MALSAKQIRFCEEYIIDLNGTQAAIRAGYSPKTANEQAARLLANVSIQDKLKELQTALSEKTGITAERVLTELAAIGFFSVTDLLKIETVDVIPMPGDDDFIELEEGTDEVKPVKHTRLTIFDTDQVNSATIQAIASIKQGRGGIEIKMHDKVKALELLGKHLGIFEKDNEQSKPLVHITGMQIT